LPLHHHDLRHVSSLNERAAWCWKGSVQAQVESYLASTAL
jgi:hypothetical protein